MEADRSLLHAPFSMLSNRVAEQECPCHKIRLYSSTQVKLTYSKKANVYCQSE